MANKKQIYDSLTLAFEELTTDDIIKLLCDCYSSYTLSELVEHVNSELGRETNNTLEDDD